ncbi:hypothetical protein ACJX0J_013104 [Zea mays]
MHVIIFIWFAAVKYSCHICKGNNRALRLARNIFIPDVIYAERDVILLIASHSAICVTTTIMIGVICVGINEKAGLLNSVTYFSCATEKLLAESNSPLRHHMHTYTISASCYLPLILLPIHFTLNMLLSVLRDYLYFSPYNLLGKRSQQQVIKNSNGCNLTASTSATSILISLCLLGAPTVFTLEFMNTFILYFFKT